MINPAKIVWLLHSSLSLAEPLTKVGIKFRYTVPYGPSPVYREFNIITFSIMGLARYKTTNRFFVIAGAGIHFFHDGVAPALIVESGYFFKAGENLKIPVSVRIYPIFGDGTPTPVSLELGVSYVLKKVL